MALSFLVGTNDMPPISEALPKLSMDRAPAFQPVDVPTFVIAPTAVFTCFVVEPSASVTSPLLIHCTEPR